MATAPLPLSRTSPRILSIGPLAVLSLGAAAIHFAVMPEHFAEWWAFGVFFGATGWFEALWAVGYVTMPTRRIAALGLVANVATVLLWAASRTVGLPIGPEPWVPEPVGLPDLVATLLEGILVLGLLTILAIPRSAHTSSRPTLRLMIAATIGASVAIAVVTTVAIALSARIPG
jgi:hypothetical protein